MLQHADYVNPTSEGAIVLDVCLAKNVLNIETDRRERKSSIIGILTSIEPIDNSESRWEVYHTSINNLFILRTIVSTG